MRIMTCNIRYYGGADGLDDWAHRRDFCIEVIRAQDADVICCQEVWWPQLKDLQDGLSGYALYALPDEPVDGHPVNPVFYRRERFRCTAQAGYWLSETPHVPGSSSWDSACVRLANWVRLTDLAAGGVELRMVNTHLDHVSQKARENQAALICADAAAYPDAFVQLLTGDMNCDAANATIQVFRRGGWRDTYEQVHGTADPGPTYHAFRGPEHRSPVGKMDWILARGAVRPVASAIITTERDGHFPSDHYFVTADVEME